ncbi:MULTISPECIES: hypothetical protein [unclassified Lentimicrobium]|uniref:hypothetical protein n=1 Tax=unclassified Lentimicrobium TaxID=2677434 RepID=UPI0015560E43|nr:MULTISPECIES: hypothetical protein [unclassified Lentimicrobium]NPD48039.1 hypothetical protein [Lentimicrobium sp. S6]NPD83935.1 hypothetical protein [Lentimicrobium sp. L6]
MEKTNIEILQDYAKSSKREITIKETPYPKPKGIRRIIKYKRTAFTPLNPSEESFLLWFYDYHTPTIELSTYCGTFIPISISKEVKIHIRSKTILHKLQLFGRSKHLKTGSKSFDSKVLITTNHAQEAKKLLSKNKIQKAILKALSLDPAMCISVNEKDIDFVSQLKNKSYISILRPGFWYVEKKEIESLIRVSESLENYLFETSSKNS